VSFAKSELAFMVSSATPLDLEKSKKIRLKNNRRPVYVVRKIIIIIIMWSQSQRNESKHGMYALVHGTAYPRVLEGQNPSRVSAPVLDPEIMWQDPAIMISDQDMDDWNGAQGIDLCYNHDVNDKVGQVRYTYLNDNDGLDLVARIPIRTPDGQEIQRGVDLLNQIHRKEIRGFSVGYDKRLTGREVTGKRLKEISLVPDPFFKGCDLTVGVYASADNGGEDSGD
jgi:hypothetical protein